MASIVHLICVVSKFSMRLVAIQSGCSQLLLLAAQMSSNWVAASPARLHLGCEGYVLQTVTRPRNPLCLSPADIHIHVTLPLWSERGFSQWLTSLALFCPKDAESICHVKPERFSQSSDPQLQRDVHTAGMLEYLMSGWKCIRGGVSFHEYKNKQEFYIKKNKCSCECSGARHGSDLIWNMSTDHR